MPAYSTVVNIHCVQAVGGDFPSNCGYATNIQGDVTALLNTRGKAVVEYTYDAWGNPLSTTGTMASTLGEANSLRYRGYVYDTETGYYYLQSRYYNPEVGRFINADEYTSTGQGLLGNNMFAYCGNDPIYYVDPSGSRFTIRDLQEFSLFHRRENEGPRNSYLWYF